MDNGIYGLTKGQASPTTELNVVTSTTRWGKLDEKMNPFLFYLGAGVPYLTSQLSSRVKELAARQPSGVLDFPIQGTGEETRSFIYIDDFVRGCLAPSIAARNATLPKALQAFFDTLNGKDQQDTAA